MYGVYDSVVLCSLQLTGSGPSRVAVLKKPVTFRDPGTYVHIMYCAYVYMHQIVCTVTQVSYGMLTDTL